MLRVQLVTLATALIVVLMPASLSAQSTKASGITSSLHKAIALREKAIALYDDTTRAADIARLHLEEVHYRSAKDPEAVEALFLAAFFFKVANRSEDARRTYETAAERALGIGDVMASAQAYLDAAWQAEKAKNKSETRRLATKAWLLSASPLLRNEQRIWIRNQIESAPAFATGIK